MASSEVWREIVDNVASENDELRRKLANYEWAFEQLIAPNKPKKPSPFDPFVWLERLINAGLDRFERAVAWLVSKVMR